MKLPALITALLISIITFAQTKEIAFKSHSGNMKNFTISLGNNIFSNEGSNFGLPERTLYQHLDSIIYLSREKAVVVMTTYRSDFMAPRDSAKFLYHHADTLINHPLYSQKHSLDSIKKVLERNRDFENKTSEIIFIGYDNNQPKIKKAKEPKKKDAKSVTGKPSATSLQEYDAVNSIATSDSTGSGKAAPLAAISLLALGCSFVSWKSSSRKKKNNVS